MRLLRGLRPEDWDRPTLAPRWSVRDVAAHLLDGDLRKLSFHRDGLPVPAPERPIACYADLVAFIDGLNAEWLRAARHISPAMLVELLAVTGPLVARFVAGLDPEAPALFAVSWAGEETSPIWLDTGREYTERWHHQQQIREAVGVPGLVAPTWLRPVFDISVRALPFGYREVPAPSGTAVGFDVVGEAGGEWTLVRDTAGWRLVEGATADREARVVLDEDAAWRLFFKALPPEVAAERVRIEGDRELGIPALRTLAVMA